MRIAEVGLIVRVDDTVAVGIGKHQVASLQAFTLQRVGCIAAAVAVDIVLEVILILDDAEGLVAIEVTDRLTFLEAGDDTSTLREVVITALIVLTATVHLCHLILIISNVPADAVGEVFTDLVAPVDSELNTSVLYGTSILQLLRETCRRRNGHGDEQVLRGLLIPVENHAELTADEACIETEVKLLRGLPSQLLVGEALRINTGSIVVLVAVEGIVTVGTILEGSEITEAVSNVLVTVLSPTCTDLQEVEPGRGLLHELLVRDYPTCRNRGEVTPTMSGSED